MLAAAIGSLLAAAFLQNVMEGFCVLNGIALFAKILM
jgi:acetoin utilization deacetylase AcuC-like enzyme